MEEPAMNQLTVRELIVLLQTVPNQDIPVELEGCDCLGEATELTINDTYVVINRNP